MRLPRTVYDASLWKARYLRGYARAVRRLAEAAHDSRTTQQIRVEAVYSSLGRPFTRQYEGLAVWIVYDTWTTRN